KNKIVLHPANQIKDWPDFNPREDGREKARLENQLCQQEQTFQELSKTQRAELEEKVEALRQR
ncbi:18696_t:CDS:2, partial [Racocetra persica]